MNPANKVSTSRWLHWITANIKRWHQPTPASLGDFSWMISCDKSFFFLSFFLFRSSDYFLLLWTLQLCLPPLFKLPFDLLQKLFLSLLLHHTHKHTHTHIQKHIHIHFLQELLRGFNAVWKCVCSVCQTHCLLPSLYLKEGKCLCVCCFSVTLSRGAEENTHTNTHEHTGKLFTLLSALMDLSITLQAQSISPLQTVFLP